jgi:hypothetical protein
MKKLSMLLISLMLAFTACEELEVPEVIVEEPEEEVEIIEYPNVYVLGYGYDYFDNYADPYMVRAQIFSQDSLLKYDMVEIQKIESSIFKTTEGRTISEYISNFSLEAHVEGHYKGFSGSAGVNFKSSNYSNSKFNFATVSSIIRKYYIQVKPDYTISETKPFLNPRFISRLNDANFSPAELFEMYGTHVMTKLTVGGRLDFNVTAREDSLSNGRSIGAYANFAYNGLVGGGSGSVNVMSEQEANAFNSSSEKTLQVYGGASEFGQGIINAQQYDAWVESVADNMVLCDYGPKNNSGLIPIWYYCENASRRSELIAAFDDWAESKNLAITNDYPRQCIVDVILVSAPEQETGILPMYLFLNDLTYYRLEYDLNLSTDGDDIYIYYAIGFDDGTSGFDPITAMFVYGDGESYPNNDNTGWQKLPMDLNKGAGGDDLYLCIKREIGKSPIRGLAIEEGTEFMAFTKYANNGFIWKPVLKLDEDGKYIIQKQDLNEGADGEDIYLYWTEDVID